MCVVDRGNVGIDLWHESIMQCPSHFPFTTPRSERGDRVRWILIDSFGFPEIISPRMHQGNWISNYTSPPPCLFPLSPSLLRLQKTLHELMPPRLKSFTLTPLRHAKLHVRQQRLKPETRRSKQNGVCNVRFRILAQTLIWFIGGVRQKKKKKKKLPWALNTMVTFTHSYWNEKKIKQASF